MSLVRPGQKTEVLLALSWHFSFPQVTLVDDAKDLLSVGWWYNDASSLQYKILYVVSFISGNFALRWARLFSQGSATTSSQLCLEITFISAPVSSFHMIGVMCLWYSFAGSCLVINALARFWWDLMLLILLLKYENHLSQIPLGACCHPSVHLHQKVLF